MLLVTFTTVQRMTSQFSCQNVTLDLLRPRLGDPTAPPTLRNADTILSAQLVTRGFPQKFPKQRSLLSQRYCLSLLCFYLVRLISFFPLSSLNFCFRYWLSIRLIRLSVSLDSYGHRIVFFKILFRTHDLFPSKKSDLPNKSRKNLSAKKTSSTPQSFYNS